MGKKGLGKKKKEIQSLDADFADDAEEYGEYRKKYRNLDPGSSPG